MFTKADAIKFLSSIGDNIENHDFTISDLKDGMNVELEHGTISPKTNITNDDLVMTGKISLAHLNEDNKYYEKLKKIEGSGNGIQSVAFDNKIYDTYSSKLWLAKHLLTPIKKEHITGNYIRYRIKNPIKNKKFYTIKIKDGIKLIIMK